MSAPLLEICQKCPAVYVCHVTPNSEMCQAVLDAIKATANISVMPCDHTKDCQCGRKLQPTYYCNVCDNEE